MMKLMASDGVAHDRFGSSVAIHGTTIVVDAPWALLDPQSPRMGRSGGMEAQLPRTADRSPPHPTSMTPGGVAPGPYDRP